MKNPPSALEPAGGNDLDVTDLADASILLVDDNVQNLELMQAYLELDAYPEVPGVLRRLRAGGLRTAILSNGAPGMLQAAARSAAIEDLLDAILSVEDVGIFKPHPKVYRLAVDRLALPPDRIAFQSSNAWDVHGAAAFGLRAVWINRFGLPPERLPGAAEHELRDLSGLPALLGV